MTEWSDTCNSPLLEFLRDARPVRLRREYATRVWERLSCLKSILLEYRSTHWAPGAYARPSATLADLALDQTIQTIIHGEPAQKELGGIRSKLAEAFPDVRQSLEQAAMDQYTQFTRAALSGSPAVNSDRPLELAIVTFSCKHCSDKALRWPTVMLHRCSRIAAERNHYGNLYREHLTNFVRKMPCHVLDKRTLPPQDFLVYRPGLICAREIVALCGFNPDVATAEEVDTCDMRLRCKMCATLTKQEIFGWRDAVSHLYHLHETVLG